MRLLALIASAFIAASPALAQTPSPQQSKDHPNSTGRTVVPEKQGPVQPQGPTGPINTGSGGAPAESPQGQTPPGMQAAPEGSSKTIVDGNVKK